MFQTFSLYGTLLFHIERIERRVTKRRPRKHSRVFTLVTSASDIDMMEIPS